MHGAVIITAGTPRRDWYGEYPMKMTRLSHCPDLWGENGVKMTEIGVKMTENGVKMTEIPPVAR
jgi:hypothetical protein